MEWHPGLRGTGARTAAIVSTAISGTARNAEREYEGRADMVMTKMSERRNVIHFPTVARPNIEEVLTLFLKDQQKRLKTRTFNRYEEVIDLLRHCLNGHGYH